MNELFYYNLKQSSGIAPSLSSQVAREIGRLIVSSSYLPGNLIEDEGALAERYEVSRSVIRDAVKVLVGKGLLSVRRGIGTRVQPRTSWGLLDDDVLAWFQSAPPNKDFLRQLMDIRQIIEPKASSWAAERGSNEDHAHIKVCIENMEKEKNSVEAYILADAHFHRSILRASNNEFLVAMEGVVFSALLGSIRLTNRDPRQNESSIPFHRKVYEAIAIRDAEAAEQAMETLLTDARHRLGKWLHES